MFSPLTENAYEQRTLKADNESIWKFMKIHGTHQGYDHTLPYCTKFKYIENTNGSKETSRTRPESPPVIVIYMYVNSEPSGWYKMQ